MVEVIAEMTTTVEIEVVVIIDIIRILEGISKVVDVSNG